MWAEGCQLVAGGRGGGEGMEKVKSEKCKTSGLFGRKGLSFIGGDHTTYGCCCEREKADVGDYRRPHVHVKQLPL